MFALISSEATATVLDFADNSPALASGPSDMFSSSAEEPSRILARSVMSPTMPRRFWAMLLGYTTVPLYLQAGVNSKKLFVY